MPARAKLGFNRSKNGMPVKVTEDRGDRTREITETIRRRAYEIFVAKGRICGSDFDDWLQAEAELLYPLQLVVEDSGDTLVVKGELPGFRAEEIEVNAGPHGLTVAAERRRQEGGGPMPPLQNALRILSTLEMPEPVKTEKATAHLGQGILEVILPKASKATGTTREAA